MKKLAPQDEGEANLIIRSYKGTVVIEFGKRMAWLALEPWRARELADMLMQEATKIDGKV